MLSLSSVIKKSVSQLAAQSLSTTRSVSLVGRDARIKRIFSSTPPKTARLSDVKSMLGPYCYRKERPVSLTRAEVDEFITLFPELPRKAMGALKAAAYGSQGPHENGAQRVLPVPYFRAGFDDQDTHAKTYVALSPFVAMYYFLDAQAQGERRHLYCLVPKTDVDQYRTTLTGYLLDEDQGSIGRCPMHQSRYLTPEHLRDYDVVPLKLGAEQQDFMIRKVKKLKILMANDEFGPRVSLNDMDVLQDEGLLNLFKATGIIFVYAMGQFLLGRAG
jgi:hypothetical protein